MNLFIFNIGLALVWVALTGVLEPANFLVGFLFGYLALLGARRALGPSPYFGKLWQVIGFVFFFLWQLILSNLRVAYDVLTPRHLMQARVLGVPLDISTDVEITTLANLISLSPGTLSVDVSPDRRILYIHAMYAADADASRREIKSGLERWILALWSKERGGA